VHRAVCLFTSQLSLVLIAPTHGVDLGGWLHTTGPIWFTRLQTVTHPSTGTHCAYPRRDGQAELTWVAGYIPRWFTHLQTVSNPSTNRARRGLTSLTRPTTSPTEPKRRRQLHYKQSRLEMKQCRLARFRGSVLILEEGHGQLDTTWDELATDRAEWHQRVAQCINLDAG